MLPLYRGPGLPSHTGHGAPAPASLQQVGPHNTDPLAEGGRCVIDQDSTVSRLVVKGHHHRGAVIRAGSQDTEFGSGADSQGSLRKAGSMSYSCTTSPAFCTPGKACGHKDKRGVSGPGGQAGRRPWARTSLLPLPVGTQSRVRLILPPETGLPGSRQTLTASVGAGLGLRPRAYPHRHLPSPLPRPQRPRLGVPGSSTTSCLPPPPSVCTHTHVHTHMLSHTFLPQTSLMLTTPHLWVSRVSNNTVLSGNVCLRQ